MEDLVPAMAYRNMYVLQYRFFLIKFYLFCMLLDY